MDEALELVHNNGECLLEAELHRLRGELLIQQGIQHKAEESLYRALETSRHQQAKSLELRAAMSLSRLWLLQEKRDTARELLVKIYDGSLRDLTSSTCKKPRPCLVSSHKQSLLRLAFSLPRRRSQPEEARSIFPH